ncbi:HPP family protein [Cladophialophora carrionii]|uniref:HPP family protein n=1 Tax=Cladophialophora carrionii TaxID=86049 RepID=A0A1C1CLP3_9EURO|nr:HPP family protein [Cladophialophora carrionii]
MSQQSSSTQAGRPQPSKPATTPFDIDNYLNPYVPRNPLRTLPTHISYWFGYRQHATQRHPYFSLHSSINDLRLPRWYYVWHLHTAFLYSSMLIGAFCGVAIIENVFLALPQLSGHTVPIVIASFGAAAILEYNTIESPLAQPRNLILGHFLSALVGVGITKLFLHLPPDRFEDLRWVAGALSVGLASILMSFSKTIHPPAGATALLAATNLEIQNLGWWLLPLVLLASMLMLASALVVNNGMGRRYPVYWWTPVDLQALRDQRRKERLTRRQKEEADVEKAVGSAEGRDHSLSQTDTEAAVSNEDLRKEIPAEQERDRPDRANRAVSYSAADRVPRPERETGPESEGTEGSGGKSTSQVMSGESILVTSHKIVTPEWLELSDWEDEVLRILMERIREGRR